MNTLTFLKRSLIGLAVIPAVLVMSGATATAAQIPYVPGQDLPDVTAPAFNIYTNIPNGIGNEADFVRIRTSTGDPTDKGPNGERNLLYIDALNAACNVGDMFDIRTYIHNGANDEYNNNGSGQSIAKNTQVAMTAPLGSNGKKFVFGSTITADNAATVTDNGTLNCGSEVRLELVPNTVKTYSLHLGWMNSTASAVNGKIKIGTHDMNSGDVWGCWDERVLVAYTVKVVKAPTPPVTPPVTPPATPPTTPQLPKTGAGNIFAIFSVTTVLGAILYRARLLRGSN